MTSHDDMRDAVASYALGALPPNEARETREHLRGCSECAAEYERLRPAVTALAYSAEACTSTAAGATTVSPLLKARILRQVRAQSHARGGVAIAYGVAAAALALAVLAGAYDASLYGRIARERALVTAQSSTIAALLALHGRRVVFTDGEVLVSKGKLYIATQLRTPPRGKVYQVWTLAKGARAVAPSVTFSPGDAGVAVITVPRDPVTLAAVAISVEPAGGSKQPTTKPLVFVRLSL